MKRSMSKVTVKIDKPARTINVGPPARKHFPEGLRFWTAGRRSLGERRQGVLIMVPPTSMAESEADRVQHVD